MDKIILPEINIMACHGVESWEQHEPQPFCIEVELELDLLPAAKSDDVTDTVHYGELYAAIKVFAESSSFALIETLAQGIAELCLRYDSVEKVRVSVEKKQAKYQDFVFPAKIVIERGRI